MARLQPMPASHELLAPFDVAIRALRPNWAKPDPEMRKEVLRLGWKVLEEKGSSSQEGIWQKLETKMAERGGVVDPKQSELSRGIFDELPPWKVRPGFVSPIEAGGGLLSTVGLPVGIRCNSFSCLYQTCTRTWSTAYT